MYPEDHRMDFTAFRILQTPEIATVHDVLPGGEGGCPIASCLLAINRQARPRKKPADGIDFPWTSGKMKTPPVMVLYSDKTQNQVLRAIMSGWQEAYPVKVQVFDPHLRNTFYV